MTTHALAQVLVCNYAPPGNVVSDSAYLQNVLPM